MVEISKLSVLVKAGAIFAARPHIVERTLREWDHIRRHREAEKTLEKNEVKYRGLFEQMREAVAISHLLRDQKGRPIDWLVTDVNPAYERIFGIPRERAVGSRASVLYGALVDLGPILAVYANVVETGMPEQFELSFPKGKHLLISVFPLGDGEYGTLTNDLTERRRMELDRERLLAELHSTIRSIADGVVVYDPEGRVVRSNPAAERLLEGAPQEVLAERVVRLRAETADGVPLALEEAPGWRALQGGTVQGFIMALHPPRRQVVWVSASAAPILNGDDRILGAVVSFSDITAMRELQQKREVLLHTVTHDLRIPLTVIQGYAQLLSDMLSAGSADGRALQFCAELLKGTQRINRMTEDLVDIARVEGGGLKVEKTDLELDAFIRQTVARAEGALEMGRLKVDIPEGLPPVPADPDRLERILLNLLSNALKFSSLETPVRLEACRKDDGIQISVIDRGKGISPGDQPRIFDRFYLVKGDRRTDSVGLGLYITRKLVEAHGGHIQLSSAPGQGSTFSFTLPLE